jgi:large subunit ribosomal protein L4
MNKAEKVQHVKSDMLHVLTPEELQVSEPQKKRSAKSFSTWVRVLMQNWRQGTVACKDRSEVARSNKKPWKQKGTGRARAGTSRSPLWRGGGIIFGPQARVKTLKVAQKQKKNVLHDMLHAYLKQGKVGYLTTAFDFQKPSTATAYRALKASGLDKQKINLFLSGSDSLTYASFVNLPNVRILFFDQPNAFDLSKGNRWVFLKKDLDMFKGMVSKWH